MWGWISRLFGKRSDPNGHELYDALSPREKAILQRELEESGRVPMGNPGGGALDGSEGFMDSITKISLNASARTSTGGLPNVGRTTVEPGETRRN